MGFIRFLTEVGVQGDGGPTHAVATDGVYLAFALPGGPRVELHYLGVPGAGGVRSPVQLQSEMQQRPVICLCFGAGHIGTSDPTPNSASGGRGGASSRHLQPQLPAVLFCGSWDAVVAWNVTAVYEAVARGHPPPPPIQVMADQGPVYCMTYSARLSFLVVGVGPDVNVFDVRTFRHLYRLDGHSADVLVAAFCPPPSSPHLLVTAGADRTFKIWDLEAGSLVMQSSVLGPAPITCLAIEPSHPPRLALGAADGSLRLFDLSSLPAARLLQVIDVGRKLGRALTAAAAAAAEAAAAAAAGPKVISSRPAWKAAMGLQRQPSSSGSDTGGGGDDEDEDGDGSGTDGVGNPYILQVSYTGSGPAAAPPPMQLPDIFGADAGASPPPLLLPACPSLLVAMSSAVLLVDTRSYDVVEAFLLGRPDPGPQVGFVTGPASAGMGRMGRGGGGGGGGGGGAPVGALAAPPPPPPPTLRSRLALRGMPRVEPSGCVAFAVVPSSTAAADDGKPGTAGDSGGAGGVLCCTAASREPTVAVLRYEPSDRPGSSSGGLGPDAAPSPLRLQRTPSAASAGVSRCSASGDADGDADGGGGGGLYDHSSDRLPSAGGAAAAAAGNDDAVAISVFQTGPLPMESPLRAPSSAAGGGGGSGVSSPAGSSRRASSAGPSRPGGSATGSATAAGKAGGGAGGRFTSPSPGRRPPAPSSGGGSKSGGGKGAPGVKNQPVTFHSKIKSSGYGFVQPGHQLGRAPPPPVKVGRAAAVSSVGRHMVESRQYPLDCGPLTSHQPKNALPGGQPVHPGGAIVRVAFSSDASRLLTASANRTARVLKLPVSRWAGEGTDLVGHGAPLVGADWSREGTLVLTASADRTARLWNSACAQPLLEFSHLNTQPPARPTGPAGAPAAPLPPPPPPAASPAGGGRSPANPLLPHEVRAARFVYMDQFIALACGNKLLLYRYKLAEDPDSDIERLRARHTYRLVASYSSQAQAITDFSAVNSFLSPLAITSASNRGLELVDLALMKPLAVVPDAHQRPVGCVAQAGTASLFVNHPREAYELFATSAPDNTVKLWDVRTPQRCVRAFTGHKNSQLPSMAVSFSPCLRYLGVGSEDKQAYLYDIRQGVVAHKVGRGVVAEAVTGIAWNPLHPQMAVSCLDGRVHFFSDGAS